MTNQVEKRRIALSVLSWSLLSDYSDFHDCSIESALERILSRMEPWLLKEMDA